MPASKSKGKRKGKKGKKGKKKDKAIPQPLPLHILTEIYTKIDSLVRQLMDGRIIARKKRKEAELLEREQESMKRDDAVYREHLNDLMLEVQQDLGNVRNLIDKERESIEKEILKVTAELQKRLEKTFKLIDEAEKKVEELQKGLREYDKLRAMVTETMEKLRILTIEYNRLRIEVLIKSTHLRNQYLNFRADLYNYLHEQLLLLISTIRSYLMPFLWDHMEKMAQRNRCHRWDLIQIDEKNFKLLETRNKLLRKVETLDGEEQYFGTEWVFVKLNEIKAHDRIERLRWKNRLKEIFKHRNLTQHYKMKEAPIQETVQPKVVIDFREFLQKRLEAIAESKDRQEKIEKHRLMEKEKLLLVKKPKPAPRRKTLYTRKISASKQVVQDVEIPSATSRSSVTQITETTLDQSPSIAEFGNFEEEGNLTQPSVMSIRSRMSIRGRTSIASTDQEKKKLSVVPAPSTLNLVQEAEEE